MATTLSALLNIRANVSGQAAVQGLNNAIGGIKGAAGAATGSLKNLTSAVGVGGLAGAMGSLAPLLSVAGLVGMAKASINTADAFYDMSQRTGVSVEMLAKFKKAAGTTGTTIDAVQGGLLRLSKAMAAAGSVDLGGKTKAEMDQAARAVEEGEERQTRAIERETERRLAAVDKETDRRLGAINKRYRQEEQKLRDALEDQAAIGESAEENAERMRARARRDALDKQLDALDARKQAEVDAVKASAKEQTTAIQQASKDQINIVRQTSAESVKALKIAPGETAIGQELEDLGLSGKGASEAFRQLGVAVRNQDGTLRSSSDVMLDIADRFKAMPDGAEKSALAMKLFGKAGAELIPMLNMGGSAIDKLTVKMTSEFAAKADEYSDKMVALGGKIGAVGADIAIALLPALTAITEALVGFFDWLNKQDPIIKNLIGTLGLVAIAFTALAPAITALVAIGTPLVTLLGAIFTGGGLVSGVLATIAGWLPVVTGFFSGLATVLAGLITWPVVLVAALVAAGVAIFVFRDQIGEFLGSVGELIQTLIQTVWDMGEPIRAFWVNLWGSAQAVTRSFFDWIGKVFQTVGGTFQKFVVDPLTKAWRFIVDTGKSALRGLLQWAANAINGVIRLINNVIAGINRVRSALGQSTFAQLSQVSVPAFAEGGFVTGPTLAMVGDNPGGREYVIPEGKAAGFAANYLAGARGMAAIPTTTGGGSTGGGALGPVTVNLSTGPIMQAADGQRSVSLEEVERLVRDGVSQTIRQLRTPAGRYATGVR